jgi:hypothetical protein
LGSRKLGGKMKPATENDVPVSGKNGFSWLYIILLIIGTPIIIWVINLIS